jgi:hypothetical protein
VFLVVLLSNQCLFGDFPPRPRLFFREKGEGEGTNTTKTAANTKNNNYPVLPPRAFYSVYQ